MSNNSQIKKRVKEFKKNDFENVGWYDIKQLEKFNDIYLTNQSSGR